MTCKEFEIGWAELENSSRLPAAMEEHRRDCRHCSELVASLGVILERAREMRLNEQPPQRVWVAVRNQLEQEGLLREPAIAAIRPGWKPAAAAGWFFRLPMGLAYAAVFLAVLGVMYLQSPFAGPGAPPLLKVSPQVPEMALVRTETAEQDKDVQELIAKVPEEHRATFEANWNQVNSSIENLSEFVGAHPNDPFAIEQLKNAQQQKKYLRGTLVQWQEF